jgi:adenosine/AMP kinase
MEPSLEVIEVSGKGVANVGMGASVYINTVEDLRKPGTLGNGGHESNGL